MAYVAWMIETVNLPFRMQQGFHFTPVESGAVLAVWPLVSMFVAPMAGLLSDRFRASALGMIGMVIALAGLLSLAILPGDPGRLDFAWRIVFCAAGFSLFMSPNAQQIIGAAPRSRMAAAGALTTTTRGAAQTMGATVSGAVLAAGWGYGFASSLFAAGLAVIALICCFFALKRSV